MTLVNNRQTYNHVGAELLRCVGDKLYGSRWQAELSTAIGVNDRSMRRWVSGEDRIPEGVWRDIRLLVESRWIDLRELEYQIRDCQKIAVYGFKRWNQSAGDFDISPIKATKHYIDRMRCEVIEGSEQFVDHWNIDDDGRYRFDQSEQQQSVSDVMSTTEGHGFHILDKHRAPQVTFEYDDQQAANNMRCLVREALSKASLVTVHGR
jgi:hypothetical protein